MFPLRIFARAQEVQGQASITDVTDAFYGDFATEESGRYWWWCREVLLDPEELIVDDGQHALYRVPFELDGEGVTFGEPREVRIQYVDALSKTEQVAAALRAIESVRGEKVAARFDERPASRPKVKKGGSMDVEQLRSILKLSADVPEEEVFRIAAQRLSEGTPEGGEGEGTPAGGEGAEGEPEGEPEGEGEGEGEGGAEGEEQPPAGTVTVDSSALAELRRQAQEGAEARRIQVDAETASVLSKAVELGKFPPARRQHWEKLMKADREGTIAMINDLEENVIPVAARGDGREVGGEGDSEGRGYGYPEFLFPEVKARKERIAAGHTRVVSDRG